MKKNIRFEDTIIEKVGNSMSQEVGGVSSTNQIISALQGKDLEFQFERWSIYY